MCPLFLRVAVYEASNFALRFSLQLPSLIDKEKFFHSPNAARGVRQSHLSSLPLIPVLEVSKMITVKCTVSVVCVLYVVWVRVCVSFVFASCVTGLKVIFDYRPQSTQLSLLSLSLSRSTLNSISLLGDSWKVSSSRQIPLATGSSFFVSHTQDAACSSSRSDSRRSELSSVKSTTLGVTLLLLFSSPSLLLLCLFHSVCLPVFWMWLFYSLSLSLSLSLLWFWSLTWHHRLNDQRVTYGWIYHQWIHLFSSPCLLIHFLSCSLSLFLSFCTEFCLSLSLLSLRSNTLRHSLVALHAILRSISSLTDWYH